MENGHDLTFVDGEIEGVVIRALKFFNDKRAGWWRCSGTTSWSRTRGR